MAATGQSIENRKSERINFTADVSLSVADRSFDALLFDISKGGAKVRVSTTDLPAGDPANAEIVLTIPRFGEFDGRVAWMDGKFIGIQFAENHKTLVTLIKEAMSKVHAA